MFNFTTNFKEVLIKIDNAESINEMWDVYNEVHELISTMHRLHIVNTNDALMADNQLLKHIQSRSDYLFDSWIRKDV